MVKSITNKMHLATERCRVCGGTLVEIFQSVLSTSVSSACLPVNRSTQIVQCTDCGLFQKTDAILLADYINYEVFDNNPLADKIIFDSGRAAKTRSELVAELLIPELGILQGKRVIEIGCQRGAFLSALKVRAPQLELHGYDLDPSYATIIDPICGVGHYHSGNLAEVKGTFDACVLIHTLEHIPRPAQTLEIAKGLLVPGGLLVIVVPDVMASPLDFYVIDHTCHFVAPVLERTLGKAGFIGKALPEIIPNELVTIARSVPAKEIQASSAEGNSASILDMLMRLEFCLRRLPKGQTLVFGTAVIGVLVAGVLGEDCTGFVDESPFQIGKSFLGRTVQSTENLVGKRVTLGIAESLAPMVARRLEKSGAQVINPWSIRL